MNLNRSKKSAVWFPVKKPVYGPIAQSIISSGYDVIYPNSDLSRYEQVVVFSNRGDKMLEAPKDVHVAWWMCDLRPPEDAGALTKRVDSIFLCNTKHLDSYTKAFSAPAYYMPQCGDDGGVIKETKANWDIVFIGNLGSIYHTNRSQILSWLKKHERFKFIQGEEYTQANRRRYRDSKISIAISPQVAGYTSNRLYNILSAGGFCLTLWFPEIEKLFENHKHLVWFKNKEEMDEAINYYLAHDEEREAIAAAGYELYWNTHTARHRLDNMFSIIEGETKGFNGYVV